MKVLIANDDGIFSPGIYALAEAMLEVMDEVVVVAPDVEQSASGHAITVRHPLRYKKTHLQGLDVEAYRVDGTPADCVVLGVHNSSKPDIVISGINLGNNLGFDVTHSGTVAAAIEGTTLGIPSIAFSMRARETLDFRYATDFAKQLVPVIATHGLPERTLLNVNFPSGQAKGVRLSKQSTHQYHDEIVKRIDPDGQPYYWVAGTPKGELEPDTDYTAIDQGYISVTPLTLDFTRYDFFDDLSAVLKSISS
jgi:5'-nucleotidase